jgi:hypothetical protein
MNEETHHISPSGAAMPADVQAWLAAQPEDERDELRRVWMLAGRARAETADPEAVAAATEHFWAAVEARSSTADTRLDRQPRQKTRWSRIRSFGWGVLGLLVGVGLGLALGPWSGDEAPGSQQEFMVLLRDGAVGARSPEEQERVVAELTAWAQSLAEAGQFRAGDELAEDGRVLRGADGRMSAEPLAPRTTDIGGYFIVAAEDYDEAIAIARGCPQLRYGGTVELRRIIRR